VARLRRQMTHRKTPLKRNTILKKILDRAVNCSDLLSNAYNLTFPSVQPLSVLELAYWPFMNRMQQGH